MSNVKKIDFYSNALGQKINVLVYLPKEYDGVKAFPVLYFLHGRNGSENILHELQIDLKADQMMEAGTISPFIIVCPRIENSRGVNSSPTCRKVKSPGGSGIIINVGMYEDYFIKEIIPLVDQTFRTILNRTGRYIGGISAGGYAALHYAMRHQEMFIKVGGHMPAIELTLEEEDTPYFNGLATWEEYDPLLIAQSKTLLPDLQFYLDAGDQDEGGFYQGCAILNNILKVKGIASQYHLFSGHHNEEYIISNLDKYLSFYGETAL